MNSNVPASTAKSKTAETVSTSKEPVIPQTPKSREAASTVLKVPVVKKYLYGLLSLVLVFGIILGGLAVFAFHSFTSPETEPSIHVSHSKGSKSTQTEATDPVKKECPQMRKCTLKGFAQPPLIILSLDGFRTDYMDTGIMKTLEEMRDCGATAKHVYPSFPSATFPNHYSISTGKYPANHGIVHNRFIDNRILPQLFVREHETETMYVKSDPLYVQYQKEGYRSACFLYPGCNKNISGEIPKYMGRIKFEMNVTLEEKFNKTIDWLLMDPSVRPGLIMVYHPEPDAEGHENGGGIEVMKPMLRRLEGELSVFMEKLKANGLIDCVNFLVVSDHGMQNVTKHYDLSTMIDLNGLEAVGGVVGKIYRKNSTRTSKEIVQSLRNWAGTDFRVYLREELPPRWHYAESTSVGDILFVEKAGVAVHGDTRTFNGQSSKEQNGQHGYDYLYDSLRTVFFAQGPSIKRGAVLEPFQNVEYLNLFRDLLGLPYYPNDGTAGLMDEVLINPPSRTIAAKQFVSECASSRASGLDFCLNCTAEDEVRMTDRLSKCDKMVPFIANSDNVCYQAYCEKSLIVSRDSGSNVILWERLSKLTQRNTSTACTVTNGRYTASTGCRGGTLTDQMISLSAAKQSEFSQIQEGMMKLPQGFINDVLFPLNRLTRYYTDAASSLLVVSGVTHDNDLNGLKDSNNTGAPSHFYRILLRCGSVWNRDGSCSEEEKLEVLSFIFPIFEKDRNDLKSEDLLLDYTARLKDVEFIAGFELEIPNVSMKTKYRLKTHIHTNLW